MPNELYASIDATQSRYTHFNLEFSGHRIGSTYALPRILRHGYFRTEGDEEPPVLSFDEILVVRCVSVREHVSYTALRDKDFRNSVPEIQNENDLKKEMLFRYAMSLPFITKGAIVERGISITTLRIIKRNQYLKY